MICIIIDSSSLIISAPSLIFKSTIFTQGDQFSIVDRGQFSSVGDTRQVADTFAPGNSNSSINRNRCFIRSTSFQGMAPSPLADKDIHHKYYLCPVGNVTYVS